MGSLKTGRQKAAGIEGGYLKKKTVQKARLLSADERRRRHLPGVPFKVLRDSEVRLFVDLALETMTFVAIAKACRERFGAERAPGKSAVHRYWLAREGLEP